MGLDHRMVQFPRSSCRCSESCIHHIANDTRHGCYAYIRQGRSCFHTVRWTGLLKNTKLIGSVPPCRRSCSRFLFYVCLEPSAHSQPSGFTGSFCGSPPSTVRLLKRQTGTLLTIVLVVASVCICIALLILTPNKQSAKWVFTEFMDGSGWGSKGFSFLLGYVNLHTRS